MIEPFMYYKLIKKHNPRIGLLSFSNFELNSGIFEELTDAGPPDKTIPLALESEFTSVEGEKILVYAPIWRIRFEIRCVYWLPKSRTAMKSCIVFPFLTKK